MRSVRITKQDVETTLSDEGTVVIVEGHDVDTGERVTFAGDARAMYPFISSALEGNEPLTVLNDFQVISVEPVSGEGQPGHEPGGRMSKLRHAGSPWCVVEYSPGTLYAAPGLDDLLMDAPVPMLSGMVRGDDGEWVWE